MNILFWGDSHIATIKIAHHNYRKEFTARSNDHLEFLMLGAATDLYAPFYVNENNQLRITSPQILQRMSSFVDSTGRLTLDPENLYIFSAGLHTSTFLTGRTWIQHTLWSMGATAGRCAMSDAVFKEMVLAQNKHLLNFFQFFQRSGFKTMVISPPPPTKKFWILEQGYSEDDVLTLNNKYLSIMSDQIAALGLPIIYPPESVAENGWLKEIYWIPDTKDPHHGNAEYSRLFLHKILDAVDQRA